MNRCLFSGRVASAPEIHISSANPQNKIAKFSFAVKDPYLRDGENNTVFLNCIVLNATRSDWVEKNVEVGDSLILMCSFRPETYVDKNGEKKYSHNFIVNDVEFNESKEAKELRKSKQNAPVNYTLSNAQPNYQQATYPQQATPAPSQIPLTYPAPQQAPAQAPVYNPAQTYNPNMSYVPQQAPQVAPMSQAQNPVPAPQVQAPVQPQPAAPIVPAAAVAAMNIPDDDLPFN